MMEETKIDLYKGVVIYRDKYYNESSIEYEFINVGTPVGVTGDYISDPHIKGLILENARILYCGTNVTLKRVYEIINLKLRSLGLNSDRLIRC